MKKHELINSKFYQLLSTTILMVAANNLCLFADSVISSRLCGADRLVGIQMASPIVSGVSFFYWMFGIGGSLIAFELKVKQKKEEGDKFFTSSIVAVIVIGILVCLLCNIFTNPLVHALCSDPSLYDFAAIYLRTYSLAFPFLSFVLTMGYFMRADGIVDIPFIAIVVTNVVNITLDFVLIKYFGLDIMGAALASVIGYVFGTLVSLAYFRSKRHTLKFSFKGIKWLDYIKQMVGRGFSGASTQIYYVIRSWFLNRYVGMIDTNALVTLTVYNNILFVPYMIYIGISQTMSPIASLFYTDDDADSVKYVIRKTIRIAVILTSILAITIILFPGILTGLFKINDPFYVNEIYKAFRVLPISYIIGAVSFVLLFYLQAIKKVRLTSILSLLDSVLLVVIYSLVLGKIFGAMGIWISFILVPITVILVYFIAVKYNKTNLFFIDSSDVKQNRYIVSRKSIDDVHGDINKICSEILKTGEVINNIDVLEQQSASGSSLKVKYLSKSPQEEVLKRIRKQYKNAAYSNVLGIHCIRVDE